MILRNLLICVILTAVVSTLLASHPAFPHTWMETFLITTAGLVGFVFILPLVIMLMLLVLDNAL